MLATLLVLPLLAVVQEGSGAKQAEKKSSQEAAPRSVWEVLKQFDKNGDGKITPQEWGRGAERFARLDLDGDGVITAADSATVGRRRPSVGRGDRGARPGGDGRRPPRPPRPGAVAPDFSLPLLGARKPTEIKLSSFQGRKPVALIFGSYT